MITFEDVKKDESIRLYIMKADELLETIGYTEHSFAHVNKVAQTAAYILTMMNYSTREIELVKIASYLHDIGNIVSRVDHSQSGALIAFRLLDKMGMPAEEIAMIIMAIGNHDETTAEPVSILAAALILADKTDVRRTRVRNTELLNFDIHDRVNYAVKKTEVKINQEKTIIKLKITLETKYCSVLDYFEIFLNRMLLCKRAALKLKLEFHLIINEQQLL
jgi:metal-dependent HD superfamily phosphatase/phosphodiesterase